MLRSESPSKPEELFVELFQEVFGPAAVAKLEMQRPFQDIAGGNRFIDFALDSLLDRYALEIDGETYHHPAALTSEQYKTNFCGKTAGFTRAGACCVGRTGNSLIKARASKNNFAFAG